MSRALAAVLLGGMLLAAPARATTRTWDGGGGNNNASTPENWVGDAAPSPGDDIVLDATTNKNMTWDAGAPPSVGSWTQAGYAGTVTVATVYGGTGFTNLEITGNAVVSNGAWTHLTNGLAETSRLRVTVGGNFVLGAGGTVGADSKGYRYEFGPGWSGTDRSGGSYGGKGGYGLGATYGSYASPTNLGSGGGRWDGEGGGAIWLTVASNSALDGVISADGESSMGNSGGSGGSIYLISGTITGGTNGFLHANGGAHSGGPNSGGGGGRAAVILTQAGADFSGFSGRIVCWGGNSAPNHGAAGTVYLQRGSQAAGQGTLALDNAGRRSAYVDSTTAIPTNTAWDIFNLVLTNGGILGVVPNSTLTLENDSIVTDTNNSDGIRLSGGGLVMVSNSLTIDDWSLTADNAITLTGDVRVAAGGKITHSGNSTSETYRLNLTVLGNLTIDAGGTVNADALGYSGVAGPGASLTDYTGGSHGGRGFNVSRDTYGSVTAPTNLGSGGSYYAIAGGGAVRLTTYGTTTVNGVISALGDSSHNNAAGAGGSVYLTTGTLLGGGLISVNGGTYGGRGGGGGRVAIVLTNSASFGSITNTAYGGTGAAAGTIYLQTAAQAAGYGELIVDNSNIASTVETLISSNVTDATVGNVIIRNGGRLKLDDNQSLTVNGDWTNGATFLADPGSVIAFAGTNAATVRGSSAFANLVCVVPGKRLDFQANSTNSVSGGLTLMGSPGNLIDLNSTAGGTYWYLTALAGATQNVSYVAVEDSDASGGDGIGAANSSNVAHNVNWFFGGATIIWTGSAGTNWGAAGSWDLGRVPFDLDTNIVIPDVANDPTLDTNRALNATVRVYPGAVWSLDGHSLTFNSNVVMQGTLAAQGSETVTFRRDADFAGGSFSAASSTVAIAGTTAQRLNLNGQTFRTLRAQNTAGPITFTNGFKAQEFTCSTGPVQLVFGASSTYEVTNLWLYGVSNNPIAMQSSINGQRWNLNVRGWHHVRHADVKDSDASGGAELYAMDSNNGGNNSNWVFDAWATWNGSASSDLAASANWTPAGAPGPSTLAVVDGNYINAPTLSALLTVRALSVGASRPSVLTLNAPLTVLEDAKVWSQGTLTHGDNSTSELYRLSMTIQGDLLIGSGGAINVDSRGYDNGKGPGGSVTDYTGASHGGRGGNTSPGCYGSILSPTNLGSGVTYWGSGGGGAIQLTVTGTTTVHGIVCARGQNSNNGAGSGGSLYLQTGFLEGGGAMTVNGGIWQSDKGGGGGRMAIYLTQGISFGSVTSTAYGGPGAAAGTIYRQRADQDLGRGSVTIDNSTNSATVGTEIPPSTNAVPNELLKATLYLTNNCLVVVSTNVTLRNLWLGSTGSVVNLNGKTLYVRSNSHSLAPGTVQTNGGAIVWLGSGEGTIFVIH